ncbi:MAG: amidohydrolase family protein, partial [Burkholderiales bacterium]|nr:amidohydrolase family protein [Burkholderiales bacterium]
MQTLQGNILTPQGWQHGKLQFDARITAIEGEPRDPVGNGDDIVLPGFIDLHVHGGGGRDVMEGGDALSVIGRTHARHGTTSLLATTMTAPKRDIERALSGVAAAMEHRAEHGSRVLGVHLEGPYINPGKLGAQPNYTRDGLIDEIDGFHAQAAIKVLTLAPEVHGHMDLIGELVTRAIRVQLGHTLGSYEDGVEALKRGATSFTHLF